MAAERVRVGGFMEDAVVMEYDFDNVTNKVTTLYYKNTTAFSAYFALFRATDHTLLYSRELPPNTPQTTLNIPSGQQPSVPAVGGYTPAFNMGTAPTASPTR